MGMRRRSRELALQFLYQLDISKIDIDDVINLFWEHFDCVDKIREFSNVIINGVSSNKDEIDKMIVLYARNWDIDRMASIDRNILRIAVYEMMYLEDIPVNVIINEAVELAKKYSTSESGKFVNGILDKVKVVREDRNNKGSTDVNVKRRKKRDKKAS